MITETLTLKNKVFQALGEASMCWNPRPSTQVFDSTEAERVGDELMKEIEADARETNIEKDKQLEDSLDLYNNQTATIIKQGQEIERIKNHFRKVCAENKKKYSSNTAILVFIQQMEESITWVNNL